MMRCVTFGPAALALVIGMFGCQSPEQRDESAERRTAQTEKRVLIVLTNHGELGDTGEATGFHLAEMTHPYFVFKEAGYQVDFVSPDGGKAPMTAVDRSDPSNERFLDNPKWVAQTKNTLAPEDVNPDQYEAIYFAGGHGTMWDLPDDQALADLTAEIYEQGGVVGAVCHGPAGLVNVKLDDGDYLVAGKEVAAFTNAEEDAVGLTEVVPFLLADKLETRGATHSGAGNFERYVVVDGRLVTGQNPASARGVAQEMVALIED